MNGRTIKFVRLSNRRTIELSDYRTVRLSYRRTIEPSDYRTRGVGLSNCRTIEPSDYRSVPVILTHPHPPFFLYAREFFICEIEVKFCCKK
jgi:hypothetical protein